MDVAIDITVTCPDWLDDLPEAREVVRRAAASTLRALWPDAPERVEVSIVLADDAQVRTLNRQYRGLDRPTNVLSFTGDGDAPAEGAPWLLGDVILAHGVIAGEAATQSKTLAAHLAHLTVHGVLHLLGHDHESDDDATAMEAQEVAILARLGIADPYRPAAASPTDREKEVAKA